MTIITIIIIILQSITSTTSKFRNLIQGGPQLVVNGVIGPLLMAENTWVTHWGYFIPISGVTWAPYQAPSAYLKGECLHLELVGGFNPFEKYARQIGNLPQIGMKIKKK